VKPRARYETAIKVISGLSVASFWAAGGLWTYYGLYLPRSPDPAAGRVYAVAYRASYSYVTRAEQCVLLGLVGAAILGILIVVALLVAREGLRYDE
jgi:hypothetical protein